MRTSAVFLGALTVVGCALDPLGTAPVDGEGGAAATGAAPASAASTSTVAGSGSTSTGETVGPGGSGGAGDGGNEASGGGGAGGGGGTGGTCGDGTVDPALGEECEEDALTCDPATCTWLGACGAARAVEPMPGGVLVTDDTSAAPSATSFATACGDPGEAPKHLHTYVTTAETSYVEVVVVGGASDAELGDPVLSLHAGCADATPLDCRFEGNAVGACCADLDPSWGIGEVLVTAALPAGTMVTAAVTGHQGDAGAYALRFREFRYLLAESFDAGLGSFTTTDWTHVASSPSCYGGCMLLPGNGDYPNEILLSGPIDASGVGVAALGWYHRVDNDFYNPADEQIVEVSADGGATWEEVYRQPNAVDELGAWKQVDVSAEIAGASDVRVRFVYADGGAGDNGWFVDEVYVLGY